MPVVLLGILDEPVEPGVHEFEYSLNKIGGEPDFHGCPKPPAAYLTCRLCGSSLPLIAQVYCPLSGSNHHRTLYIFGCTRKSCWNKHDSWKVIRQQTKYLDVDPAPAPGDSWAAADDDWGVEADDWGDDADDCTTTSAPDEADKSSACGSEKGIIIGEANGGEDPTDLLKEMCIDDVEDGASAKDKDVNNVYKPEALTEPSPGIMNVLNVKDAARDSDHEEESTMDAVKLKSYYVNVFEEPEDDEYLDKHEVQLQRDYEKREGRAFECLPNDSGKKGSGKGGSSDGYEKAEVKHQDKLFYRFNKRVHRLPGQILRYSYNGTVLPLVQTCEQDTFHTCSYCGSPVIYEMQLMPALVHALRPANSPGDPAVEFGTVVVYTCAASCWEETATHREERIVVQVDPDQHLFK